MASLLRSNKTVKVFQNIIIFSEPSGGASLPILPSGETSASSGGSGVGGMWGLAHPTRSHPPHESLLSPAGEIRFICAWDLMLV